ncbi:MAG: hypothetical protein SGPRY_012309, partial [Prymnesium sp.]
MRAFDLCGVCGVRVPSTGWEKHRSGRRHLSFRFFGEDGHRVCDILVSGGFESNGMTRIRPSDVPQRISDEARRARADCLARLFAHSGHALFERARSYFNPEVLCAHLMGEKHFRTQSHEGWRLGSASMVACLAAEWSRCGASHAPEEQRVWIEMPLLQAHEAALSCALESLASSIPHLPAGSSLQLRLGRCLRHRHLAAKFLRRLQSSLHTASITRCTLFVDAQHSAFRDEDEEALVDSALCAWRGRVLAILLGSHTRVGASSPLRMLPPNLMQIIVELVAASTRTHVELLFQEPSVVSMPASSEQHNAPQQGADLDHVAQFA